MNSMVITHNLSAMFTDRQLNITTGRTKKSAEKLSSGYKINRAADDAAGLTISEKMRSQIRGLNQGSDNIQDGIHLIQIADGGLNEVCDMLHRLNELSVKALNDTNTRADREAMQAEVDQIVEEINRVSETTEYNTKKLLQGKYSEIVDHKTEKQITSMMPSAVPAWVDVQKSLSVNNYNNASMGGASQRTDIGRYLSHGRDSSGNEKDFVYYGPSSEFSSSQYDQYGNSATYTNEGGWSGTLSDNLVSQVSFESIKNTTSIDELYDSVIGLLGSAICVQYADGSGYSGVLFSGETESKKVSDSAAVRAGGYPVTVDAVNITNGELLTTANGSSKDYEDKTILGAITAIRDNDALSDSDKAEQTEKLADDISRVLAKTTVDAVNQGSKKNVYTVSLDDYSFLFYDLRDKDKLTATIPASKVMTDASVETTHYEWEHYVDIQCSSKIDDTITIELPDMKPEKLDITGYNIAEYNQHISGYETKTIDYPEHVEEVADYEYYTYYDSVGNAHTGYRVTGKHTETIPAHTETVSIPIIDSEEYIRPDITRVQKTLDYVLDARQKLGAAQNRLEHTYNNNQNKAENTTAAESRIRDTDMALEMVKLAKDNILTQAGTAMLSQTMQNPQNILQLLS